MTKNQQLIEKVIVTFFEGVIAYLTINQTNLSGDAKTVAIGATAFGLSAVYNLLRQSTPPIASSPTVVAAPEVPLVVAEALGAPAVTPPVV